MKKGDFVKVKTTGQTGKIVKISTVENLVDVEISPGKIIQVGTDAITIINIVAKVINAIGSLFKSISDMFKKNNRQ